MYVVYQITNITTKQIYIGSTSSFFHRRLQHIEDLELCRHHNYKLQSDWNVYGRDCFKFEVILQGFKSRESMLLKEYELINKFKKIAYNIDLLCPIKFTKRTKAKKKFKKKKHQHVIKCKPKAKKRQAKNAPSLSSILSNKKQRELHRSGAIKEERSFLIRKAI